MFARFSISFHFCGGMACESHSSFYKTSDGLLINADINGSLNIMRKHLNEVCDDLISPANRGLVMNPVKIQF